MKKTTNKSPDKIRSIHGLKNIKFDLNPINYMCFITKRQKQSSRVDSALPPHLFHSTQSQQWINNHGRRAKDLRIPYIRKSSNQNGSIYYPQFNTQVLLMQYDKDQVYIDSTKNQQQKQGQIDSKSINSQGSEQNQIVKSCLKMINQETDTDSSTPPRSSLPRSISDNQLPSTYYGSNLGNFYSNYRCQNPQINSFTIDLSRIQQDGRTTIMIRNIPNKYTQNLLLELFNKNHKKRIDFFYLPIDYKNNCNVGYAFLNFIHPKYIEEFYNQFHNRKWKLFNSQKICHVCYARIQGTFQLSNHFQGSKKLRECQK